MRRVLMLAVGAVALVVISRPASAGPIVLSTFSGTGTTGFLASGTGEPWLANCAGTGPSSVPCPTGDFGWGSPGVGQGITPYVGTTAAEDFEITFPGFLIDPSQITVGNNSNCTGRETGGTTFCTEDRELWTAVFNPAVDAHSIAFFAPAGTQLDPTESYFVNIFLVNPGAANNVLPESVPFTGEWTAEPVPEPVTLVLFGTGLAAAAALRRRQLRARD
jgi:hypothetical protein